MKMFSLFGNRRQLLFAICKVIQKRKTWHWRTWLKWMAELSLLYSLNERGMSHRRGQMDSHQVRLLSQPELMSPLLCFFVRFAWLGFSAHPARDLFFFLFLRGIGFGRLDKALFESYASLSACLVRGKGLLPILSSLFSSFLLLMPLGMSGVI